MKQQFWQVVVLSTVLCTSCQEKIPEQSPIEYSVLTLTPTNITQMESYSATVRGRQDIEIYPQIEGTIKRVCIKEGQLVKEGELLFVIDQVPYQAALQTAIANVHAIQAQVESAKLNYESKQFLFHEHVISLHDLSLSRNSLAEATATLEQAQAQELNARNNLSYTEIKSPANGVIGNLPYRVGTLVSPTLSQPLTTVSDNSEMYVYFSMAEQQLQTLVRHYGSIEKTITELPSVQLQLSDGSTYEQSGRIESISGILDLHTGSGSLRAVFPNEKRILFSGGTGNVLIPNIQQNVISIPQNATYELQDKIFVYRVVDGKAINTRITVHPVHDGNNYIVTSGLKPGDVIVATGIGLLKEGDTITIKNEQKKGE